MEIPNLSLAYQVAELRPVLEGSILRKVQELDNGWLKLRFQTRQGTKDLIASPKALFFTSFSMPAKQQTSGYGAFLRKQISNKKVASFEQQSFDRIALIHFQDFVLIFELFAKGNVVLTDKKNHILSAFRKEQWKDRSLRKGEEYKFPSSKGLNPIDLDAKALGSLFKESENDTIRSLVKAVNIAPILAEEACSRAVVEKEKPASKLNVKELREIAKQVKDLYSIDLKKEQPIIVEKDGKEILLPFSLNLPGIKLLQSFSSVNQALDSVYSKQFGEASIKGEKESVGKKEKELQKSLERQKEALETLQLKIESNAEKAELIYANYSGLFELLQAVQSLGIGKLQKKEIMYKLKKDFPFLKGVDLKNKKLVVELEK